MYKKISEKTSHKYSDSDLFWRVRASGNSKPRR